MKVFMVFSMALVSGLMIPASVTVAAKFGNHEAILVVAIGSLLAVGAVWRCVPSDPNTGQYLDHYLYDNGLKIWGFALLISSVAVVLSL